LNHVAKPGGLGDLDREGRDRGVLGASPGHAGDGYVIQRPSSPDRARNHLAKFWRVVENRPASRVPLNSPRSEHWLNRSET
jgi:hypothetical protein